MRNRDNKEILFAITISLISHILLFAFFIFLPKSLDSRSDSKERIIVTRLVALGVPRNEKILPRLDEGSIETKKEIIINSEEPASTKEVFKKDEKKTDNEFNKRLLSSINKVKRMIDTRSSSPPIGDPNGSPLGDSTEGQKGDIYLTEIYNKIKSNYVIPDIISEKQRKELRAIIIIYIDTDGKLIRYEFEKKSGNAHFDNALINAITRSSPFSSPPKERARIYKMHGIGINFSIE
ncbi:MAG: TonB C-terminal domain-containing protein [Deltaproteobacteria bacterium]|nr:TonB C-terminal domain-containing protein [Deltaproteobacteria bacterium]